MEISPKESMLQVAGSAFHLITAGDGSPVMYLHGSRGASFSPFLGELARQHTVYAPEHPGFGTSELPFWLETVTDLAIFYLDVLDTLGLSSVDVVGSSFGGWLAAEIAVLAPRRIRRMVLADPVGVVPPPPEAPDFFMIPPEELDQWLFHRPPAKPPAEQDPMVAAQNRTTVARFAWSPRFYNPKLKHWLYRIAAPTLVIWGENDRLVPAHTAQTFLEQIPDARLETIADCGHLPYLEQTERFVELVEAHLAG